MSGFGGFAARSYKRSAQKRQDNLNRALGDDLERKPMAQRPRRQTIMPADQPARGRRGTQRRYPRVRAQ
jgi:hypothetical protein